MASFRSIRLWYWRISLLALLPLGCATSYREKIVEHPIPRLYGTEDSQFSRTMGTLLGTGIMNAGVQVRKYHKLHLSRPTRAEAFLKTGNIGQDASVLDANDKDAFIAAAKTRQWDREKSVRPLA